MLTATCELCGGRERLSNDHPCPRCTRVAELRRSLADLEAQKRLIEIASQNLEAEIADLGGRAIEAAWRRLSAQALRTRDREDHARAHEAWVVFMADLHLRAGTVPDDSGAAEIESAMDELRAMRANEIASPDGPAASGGVAAAGANAPVCGGARPTFSAGTSSASGRAAPGTQHADRGRELPLPGPAPAACSLGGAL